MRICFGLSFFFSSLSFSLFAYSILLLSLHLSAHPCLSVAWVFGWLGWSVLWLILLGVAIWKVRQREMENGWRIFYRNAERRRKHQLVRKKKRAKRWEAEKTEEVREERRRNSERDRDSDTLRD